MKTKLFLLSLVDGLKSTPKKTFMVVTIGFLMTNLGFGQVTWTVTCPSCTNFPTNDTVCAGQTLKVNYSVQNAYSVATTYTVESFITHPSPSIITMTVVTIPALGIYAGSYTVSAPSSVGIHQVEVEILYNTYSSTNSTYDQTIQVKLSPNTPTVTASGSTVLCPNSSLTLNSSSITGNVWNTTAITQSITVNSAGAYFVTNTNQCGSTNSNTVSITISATPTIDVNSGAVCAGTNYTLVPTGADTYTYSSGNAVVTPTANTSYTVIGTDTNGCVSAPAIANVTINALPSLTVTVLSPTVCTGALDTLVVHGASTYTWSTGYVGQVFHPTLTATTHYTVTGTNVNGCKNSDTATVTVYNCSTTDISKYGYEKSAYNVYPNPATQTITIGKSNGTESIEIYNAIGQLVKSTSAIKQNIDVSDLEKGFYFIIIEGETNNQLLKFIKE